MIGDDFFMISISKIMVPLEFSGFLLYVVKLARVLATYVKRLLLVILFIIIIILGMVPPALLWPSLFEQCLKLILNWPLVFILVKQNQMILEKQLMPTGTGLMEKVYYQVNFCCNNRTIKAQKLRRLIF